MTAVLVGQNQGVLTCNAPVNRWDECPERFLASPGESVLDAEARSRNYGWATVEAFGRAAHICPAHAK